MKRTENATAYIVSEFIQLEMDENGIDVKACQKKVKAIAPGFASKKGCYVFFNKGPNQGRKPIYIGLTKRNMLVKEAFAPRTILLITQYAHTTKKSKIEIAFIVPEQKRGPSPQVQIADIERALVAIAADKNPELINTQHVHKLSWYIKGVLFAKQGEDSVIARNFRDAMGIRTNPTIVYKHKKKKQNRS